MSIFFILGAGASVDSGLYTYRGDNSRNENYDDIVDFLSITNYNTNKNKIWEYYKKFYDEVQQSKLGKTYYLIEELCKKHPDSFVLTQNVDGLINSINVTNVELHGNVSRMKCTRCKNIYQTNFDDKNCTQCGGECRLDILLYNEYLDDTLATRVYELIARRKPKYLVVIGTSLQFDYLNMFINKTNISHDNRYHINPNINYVCGKKDHHINKPANDGLEELLNIL
jgi:NAD-dependent deacetylase